MSGVGEKALGAEATLERGDGPARGCFAGVTEIRFGGLVVPLLLVGDIGEGDEGK